MLSYEMADHQNTLVHEASRLMLASVILYLCSEDMASLTGERPKVISRKVYGMSAEATNYLGTVGLTNQGVSPLLRVWFKVHSGRE